MHNAKKKEKEIKSPHQGKGKFTPINQNNAHIIKTVKRLMKGGAVIIVEVVLQMLSYIPLAHGRIPYYPQLPQPSVTDIFLIHHPPSTF